MVGCQKVAAGGGWNGVFALGTVFRVNEKVSAFFNNFFSDGITGWSGRLRRYRCGEGNVW